VRTERDKIEAIIRGAFRVGVGTRNRVPAIIESEEFIDVRSKIRWHYDKDNRAGRFVNTNEHAFVRCISRCPISPCRNANVDKRLINYYAFFPFFHFSDHPIDYRPLVLRSTYRGRQLASLRTVDRALLASATFAESLMVWYLIPPTAIWVYDRAAYLREDVSRGETRAPPGIDLRS